MLPLPRSRLRDDIVDRLAALIASGELDRPLFEGIAPLAPDEE